MPVKEMEMPIVPLQYQDIDIEQLIYKLHQKATPPKKAQQSQRKPFVVKESISPTRYMSKSLIDIQKYSQFGGKQSGSKRITIFDRLSLSTPTPGPGDYFIESGETSQIVKKSMVERWKKEQDSNLQKQQFLPGLLIQKWKQKSVKINESNRGLILPQKQLQSGRSVSQKLRSLGFTGCFQW
ncbi:hypothetical protein SS50377_20031 [Spironucleus salmonicida]|uniref:Uncharacterized protein n=1 Tax=Spironucleus salmonicida TaxID=348837 RepID=V6LXW9_9EUKA|nr:hypothetical protein SS50377_20031 [Spironucleus salmonicida]|eukprot:EST49400.1 Hypothetical protein SS50377_10325 [Spironucleus salmonicida]